jgi:hypothetical protein
MNLSTACREILRSLAASAIDIAVFGKVDCSSGMECQPVAAMRQPVQPFKIAQNF